MLHSPDVRDEIPVEPTDRLPGRPQGRRPRVTTLVAMMRATDRVFGVTA
jgi:hypothetical protein